MIERKQQQQQKKNSFDLNIFKRLSIFFPFVKCLNVFTLRLNLILNPMHFF